MAVPGSAGLPCNFTRQFRAKRAGNLTTTFAPPDAIGIDTADEGPRP